MVVRPSDCRETESRGLVAVFADDGDESSRWNTSGVFGRGRSRTEVLLADEGGPGKMGAAANAGRTAGAEGRGASRREEVPFCGANTEDDEGSGVLGRGRSITEYWEGLSRDLGDGEADLSRTRDCC